MNQTEYIRILEEVNLVESNLNKLSSKSDSIEGKIDKVINKKLPAPIVKSAKEAANERLEELNNIYSEEDLEKYVIQFLKYFFPNDFPLGLNSRSEIGLVQGAVFIYKFNRSHGVSNSRSVVSALLFVTDNLLKFSEFGGRLKMEDITKGVRKYTNSTVFGVVGSIISLILNALFTLPQFILKGISYAFGIGFVKMAFRKLSGKSMLAQIADFSPNTNWCTKVFEFFGISLNGDSARRLVQLTNDPMVKYFMLFSIALPIVFVFFRLIKVFILTLKGSKDDKDAPIIRADKLKDIKESSENIKVITLKKYKLYKESGLIEYCRDNPVIKCFREGTEERVASLMAKVEDLLKKSNAISNEDKQEIKQTTEKTIDELQDLGNVDETALKKYIGNKVFEKYNLPKDLRIGAFRAAKITYKLNRDAGRNPVMCFIVSFFIFIRFIYFVVTRQNIQSKLNSEIAKTIQHPFLYWLSTTLAIAIPTMIAMAVGYTTYKGGIPQAIGAEPKKSLVGKFLETSFVVACLQGFEIFLSKVFVDGIIIPLALMGNGLATKIAGLFGYTTEILKAIAQNVPYATI